MRDPDTTLGMASSLVEIQLCVGKDVLQERRLSTEAEAGWRGLNSRLRRLGFILQVKRGH